MQQLKCKKQQRLNKLLNLETAVERLHRTQHALDCTHSSTVYLQWIQMIIKQTYNIPIDRKPTSSDVSPLTNIASFSPDTKPNIFSIEHATNYKYSEPVSFSKHLYRLQPLYDMEQAVLYHKFSISVDGEVCNFTGAFGNNASFVLIRESYSELTILSESVVSISSLEVNQSLAHQPRTLPLIWMPWDRVMLQAYLQPPELPESELFDLANYAMSFVKRNNNDVLEMINDINLTIYKDFAYVPGSTTLFTTPYQVYFNRKGVCQDFAHLFICLARLLNIPARYRVGYIYTGGDYENKIQSDASHAWVEVYLPYLGWKGFDPTNGCLAGKNHIKVACGRHYNDATPTSGTIFNAQPGTTETLSTYVKVIKLNQ